jgi:hypothetical protein
VPDDPRPPGDGGTAAWPVVPDVDEGRHEPGAGLWWNESWYFDFAAADESLGGYVRLGYYPNQRVAWWWAYLVGQGRPLVALRAHEVPIPRAGLEIRDDGLWACLTAETPNEHWSVGLEAFAVAFDDPLEAYRGEVGDRMPFGLDLEWEAAGPAFPYPGVSRYEQSCNVYGEVLVGDEHIAFQGPGQRDHSWGERDWWRFGWVWTSGHLDDGTRFHASAPRIEGARYEPGYLLSPSRELLPQSEFTTEVTLGELGVPTATAMTLGPLQLKAEPIGLAPILLAAPDGRVSRFPRSMCRFTVADGRRGVGWTEWNQPQA